VFVGAAGQGLPTAYHLAQNHGITNLAVVERGWLAATTLCGTRRSSGRTTSEKSTAICKHALTLWDTLLRNDDLLLSRPGVLSSHTLPDIRRGDAAGQREPARVDAECAVQIGKALLGRGNLWPADWRNHGSPVTSSPHSFSTV
jgi:glycine/D-amino acid oxidase-like deaminating enzyme